MPKRKSTRFVKKGKGHLQSLNSYRQCRKSFEHGPNVNSRASTVPSRLTTSQKVLLSVLAISALMIPVIEATEHDYRGPKTNSHKKNRDNDHGKHRFDHGFHHFDCDYRPGRTRGLFHDGTDRPWRGTDPTVPIRRTDRPGCRPAPTVPVPRCPRPDRYNLPLTFPEQYDSCGVRPPVYTA